MKEKNKGVYEDLGPPAGPETTLVSWGLVLQAPIESIPDIRRDILRPGVRIIYQRLSGGHLWVVDETEANFQSREVRR